jgi:pyruvate dehydrogenase E2 component (dihydrolipoamide acetyltransferase)
MAKFLRMPSVSADADTAILSQWSVEAGASVSAGDAVAEVETEKAVVDIEVDSDAVVHALLVEDGATVGVSDPIAVLLEEGDDAAAGDDLVAQLGGAPAAPAAEAPAPTAEPAPAAPAPAAAAEPAAPAPAAASEPAPSSAAHGGRIFSSPIARKIARENNLDIATLTGSGPNGRIVRKDVEAAIAAGGAQAAAPAAAAPAAPVTAPASPAPAPSSGGYEDVPHSKIRRYVASRLQESKQLAPHFYLKGDVQVDRLLALRKEINEGAPTRVSVNDFFVRAVARALQDVPEMNVTWSDDFVRRYERSDVAVAIASEKGLVTPVVRNADERSLTSISKEIKDFAERASGSGLKQDELVGGSFTVTNLGMFGVDEFSAILNPPQAGILAVGAARKVAVIDDDGEVRAASVVSLTLSVDHRPVDGALAATFFKRLREIIENPTQILA